MCYTEEQIKKYLEILSNYTNSCGASANQAVGEENRRIKCWNCQSDCFFVNSGYNICDSCGTTNGHVLGHYDQKDYDRLHFRKKSIYQRRYHYEKKIDQVSERLHLTEDQKHCLYNKLMAIDNHVMEIINKKFCRKRMISIFYLIKKLLEEMGNEKYKLVYLKISGQTLENCEKWWNSYKSLNYSSVKAPVNNPS